MQNTKLISRQMLSVKDEWEKFHEGQPLNMKNVSSRIYSSWQRSRKHGLDPFLILDDYIITKADSCDHFIESAKYIYQNFEYMTTRHGLEILFFDKMGRWINNLSGEPTIYGSAAENIIGTNAACLAMIENKPGTVLGYEHYLKHIHDKYCAAAPVHNNEGEILGVINIIGEDIEQIQRSFIIVTCMSAAFDSIYGLINKEKDLVYSEKEINKVIDELPQGIAILDANSCVKYYNDKILDILRIGKNQDVSTELKKHFMIFNTPLELKSKETIINVGGVKKRLSVSTRDIGSFNLAEKQKLILLEEINSGSKVYDEEQENYAIYTFDDIIGQNNKILDAKQTAIKVSKWSTPVLIYGESGTGKELFAQAIHNNSQRKNGPFMAINCGAIPKDLVESELFGYEPGAFTGALKNGKKGQIEAASGGTLFLDEIESMPLHVQIKLLRMLSTGRILKVGGVKEIPVDVRIISATKKDLLQEADNGNFREDLYYRISTVTISLPPLRERTDDIPLLANFIVNKLTQQYGLPSLEMEERYLNALCHYYWRGNVRELENTIERSLLLIGDDHKLKINHLPEKVIKAYNYKSLKEKLNSYEALKSSKESLLKLGEEIIIESALSETQCNLSEAAKLLGIDRKTIYNKIHGSEKLRKFKEKIIN